MVQNSKTDAPSDRVYEQLLQTTTDLDYPFNHETRWILIAAGRLGMRAGELSHMRENWINWERHQIEIPAFDPCDQGKGGAVCGYCRDRASEKAENNEDVTMEKALENRWEPKTPHSVRAIPFDFDERIERMVIAFWDAHDVFPRSRATVNRRVNRVLEAAGYPKDYAYPHSLRAAAATYHAYRGLPAAALQSFMGWKKLSVAEKYIRLSGTQTAEALRAAHQD